MLPQKKNADAAELARAKAHRLASDLAGLLGVTSGLPLTYNKDLQEDKGYLFDAADTVDLLLTAMTGMLAGAAFRTDRMAAACAGGTMGATDLADHLVRVGWPFRRAHEAVGGLVRSVLARGAGPRTPRRPSWRPAASRTSTCLASMRRRRWRRRPFPAGTARSMVVAQLEAARSEVATW